jgi:hypothetical protein
MGLPEQRVKLPGIRTANDCSRGPGRPGVAWETWNQDRTVLRLLQALAKSVVFEPPNRDWEPYKFSSIQSDKSRRILDISELRKLEAIEKAANRQFSDFKTTFSALFITGESS